MEERHGARSLARTRETKLPKIQRRWRAKRVENAFSPGGIRFLPIRPEWHTHAKKLSSCFQNESIHVAQGRAWKYLSRRKRSKEKEKMSLREKERNDNRTHWHREGGWAGGCIPEIITFIPNDRHEQRTRVTNERKCVMACARSLASIQREQTRRLSFSHPSVRSVPFVRPAKSTHRVCRPCLSRRLLRWQACQLTSLLESPPQHLVRLSRRFERPQSSLTLSLQHESDGNLRPAPCQPDNRARFWRQLF